MPNTQSNSTQQTQPQFTFEGGHLVMFHQEQTGLPQTRDANVNDRDRMYDLLNTEKMITTEYHTAMLEAADEQLFNVLKQCHDNCHQVQRQLFNTAFKKGWYRIPVAEAQAVVAAFTKFQQTQKEFPFPVSQQTKQQSSSVSTDGQWPQLAVAATNLATNMTTTTAYANAASSGGMTKSATQSTNSAADQKLQQVVSQAIQEAQQGKTPSYRTH